MRQSACVRFVADCRLRLGVLAKRITTASASAAPDDDDDDDDDDDGRVDDDDDATTTSTSATAASLSARVLLPALARRVFAGGARSTLSRDSLFFFKKKINRSFVSKIAARDNSASRLLVDVDVRLAPARATTTATTSISTTHVARSRDATLLLAARGDDDAVANLLVRCALV